VPGRGIQHVDLCVSDAAHSLAFYTELLGPLGLEEDIRVQSYRGTEEVVYLRFGEQNLGLRPADGGEHRYYDVGIEHLAFEVENREEVDAAFESCQRLRRFAFRLRKIAISRTTTRCSCSILTASAWRFSVPSK
jgi:catechol 2,3-dioxygenase-like lactoylglutathione lyase family enzyme